MPERTEWDDREWDAAKLLFRRRWLGWRVMRLSDEGGADYFEGQQEPSLYSRFMSKFVW